MADITPWFKTDGNSSYKQEVLKLINVFSEKYPNNYIIPCDRLTKNPIYKHKDGKYNWEYMSNYDNEIRFDENSNIGIILKDLIVIDLDLRTIIEEWETKFPILQETVSEDTRNGRHYYFKRSPRCEEYQITDTIGLMNKVDIKTITKTGTGGIIIVSPSPNKRWFLSPFDNEIKEIPDEIVEYIFINTHKKKLLKDTVSKTIKDKERKKQNLDFEINKNTEEYQEEITALMGMVSKDRSVSYERWFEIVCCLKNIAYEQDKDHEYYKILDDYSKDHPKYDPESNLKIWKRLPYSKTGFNIGSLKYWAKQDNEEAYEYYKKKNLVSLIYISLKQTDFSIANVFYYMYKKQFISLMQENGKGAEWYVFKNHRWQRGGIKYIKTLIPNEFANEYRKLVNVLKTEIENGDLDEDAKTHQEDIIAAFEGIINKLETIHFTNDYIKAFEPLFAQSATEVLEKFDSKKNLICFTNGVLDIDTREFRDGKPEDYISLCTNSYYTEERVPEIYNDLVAFFTDITDSQEKYTYILNNLAYALHGNKCKEMMAIWIGNSRNGKGVTALLLKLLLGEYYLEIPCDIITDRRNKAGQANSDLARTKGRRIVLMSEPKEDEKIQINLLKNWVGNDDITARFLFKDSINFKPQFQLILQVNEEPEISNYEPAFINKLEMLEFPYSYVIESEMTQPFHKLVDLKLKKRFEDNPQYAQQFLHLLLDHYQGFNYKVPDFIRARGKDYLDNNNKTAMWIEENYIITDVAKDRELRKDVYDRYRRTGDGLPKIKFYKEVTRNGVKLIKSKGEFYYNLRDINTQDDDEPYKPIGCVINKDNDTDTVVN